MATQTSAERHQAAMASIEQMFAPPADQSETPAPPDAEVPEQANETADATQQGTETQEQPEGTPSQSADEVEIEIEGETYLVPKKIADSIERHADYTRKSQDVAEMRRALTAEREAATLQRAFNDAVAPEQKQLDAIDATIDQFKQLDWSRIEDTAQLLHLRTQLDQLKDTRADLEKSIAKRRGEFEEQIKRATQEATAASRKFVEQKIKGFDDAKRQDLFAYLLTEGYARDELDRLTDPRIVVSFWKARQWDALQASKPSIANRASQAAPVVKPGATKPTPTRIQQLSRAIKDAKSNSGKVRAAEAYFSARFDKANGG